MTALHVCNSQCYDVSSISVSILSGISISESTSDSSETQNIYTVSQMQKEQKRFLTVSQNSRTVGLNVLPQVFVSDI